MFLRCNVCFLPEPSSSSSFIIIIKLYDVRLQKTDFFNTFNMWSKSVRNLSEMELLIILWIFAHVMSCHDLDLWPLDLKLLQHLWCHAFKLYKIWAKSINPRLSYRRFSAFSRAILQGGVGQNWQSFLRGAWTQLHWTWPRHRAIIAALHFCLRIRTLCYLY